MSPELKPITTLENFKGTWARGNADDCPIDHALVCTNFSLDGAKDITTRPGLVILNTLAHTVVSFFYYSSAVKAAAGGTNFIYMTITGAIYDGASGSLLITWTGATDFVAIELFGRVYISPKVNGIAQSGQHINYWDGTNVYPIAGPGPVSAATLAQVNAGIVNAGLHQISFSWQYATGYLSPPAPLASINSVGNKDIELSAIPNPPTANIVGFVLLMSLSAQTELFFVPNGFVASTLGSPVNLAVINVYDTSLISSANYLYNIMTTVPGGSHMGFYNGRLLIVGRNDFPFIVMYSDLLIFDSFNVVNGSIQLPLDNAKNAPSAGLVIRNVSYILKPYGTYGIQDNGGVPNTWSVTPIDSSLGGYDGGVSTFSSGLSGADIFDTSFVVHPHGLMLFNGAYGEVPLSWKIDNLWTSIAGTFNNLVIAHDINNKLVYILVPPNKAFLIMDYNDGLSPKDVRWLTWQFNNSGFPITFTNISFVSDQAGNYFLALCYGATFIYGLNALQGWDVGVNSTISLEYLSGPIVGEKGCRTCYTGIRLRAYSSTFNSVGGVFSVLPPNVLFLSFRGQDATNSLFSTNVNTLISKAIGAGVDFYSGANTVSEKMFLELSMSSLNVFTIDRIDIFGNTLYRTRTYPYAVISNVFPATGGNVGITAVAHGLGTGKVNVLGVTGTIEANGSFTTIVIIDSNNFYIPGLTFSNTYTGGGIVWQ